MEIFPKILRFEKSREHVQNILNVSYCTANFSLIYQKMDELSAFSFFSMPVTLYYKNSNACLGMFTRKQMVSLDFWAQTASAFQMLLVTFEIWTFLTWPWPNLQFSLLKMPSDSQTDTIIELCGQNGLENLCHMTYIFLQNFRDFLWPSFDLKYTLYMLDTPRVRSIWI